MTDDSELRGLIKKQIELQEETNGILRGLIATLQNTAQEIHELREDLRKSNA
ncbi:Tfp pilus assembly protein PilN [Bradyrhizobium elkanii]|uniref:hypothetical protein n=1 Tax=Bradyrhizobium elkanii TaxID=29448 RepID=UPI0035192A5B